MRTLFWNFGVCFVLWYLHYGVIITLVLVLCSQKLKCWLLWNHLFQRIQEDSGWKEPQGNDKPLLKAISSSHHIEWKHFVAACSTNNIHTGKNIFCSCYTFEGFWVVSFQTELKNLYYIRPVWLFFGSSEKRRPNKYWLWEVSLFIYTYIWSAKV